MRRTFPLKVLLPALACVALGSRTTASETVATLPAAEPLAELWSEPDDIASRDLLNGEGGPESRAGASLRSLLNAVAA